MAEKECWLKTKAEISWNVRRSTQRVYCKLHFFVLHRYWQHAHLDLYWRKQNRYFRFYSCDAVYVWAFFHDVDFNSNEKKRKTEIETPVNSFFLMSWWIYFKVWKKKSRRWTLHKSGLSLFYLFFTNNANMIHSYRKTRSNNLITFNDQAMIRWGKL